MRVVSVAFACVLSAALGGCAFFADPNAWPQSFKYGDSATIASGSGIRFVNERAREMPGTPPLPTMCTEPSPDVAVAFGRSLAIQGSAAPQGGGNYSGALGAGTSEAAIELAGRTAGVLALRDGLYATCQAYNNGALGQSAYALGLSQYGNLLINLTANSSTTGGATGINAVGPTITLPGGSGGVTVKPAQQSLRSADAGDDPPAMALIPVQSGDDPPPVIPVQAGGTPGKGLTNANTNPTPVVFQPSDSAAAAIMVSCISEYDPTRLGALDKNGYPMRNRVLTEDFCREYLKRFSLKLMATKMK